MTNGFNQQIIDEFRANGGRVGGPFEGARLLLLTTVGARSGRPHTTPLAYLPDGGERVLVIGSAGGASKHPDWYHNLVAEPRVTVEDGVFVYEAHADVLHGTEREQTFARATEADPGWADYQAATTREIPVVTLHRIPGPPRFAGVPNPPTFGAALTSIHGAFRRELALIRREVGASGPGLAAQLRINCLTLCQGLHHHHSAEDGGMFLALADSHPEAAGTLQRLRKEHLAIAALLDDLQAVISTADADRGHVLAEVERLTDALEQHLTYEEEQLIPLLGG